MTQVKHINNEFGVKWVTTRFNNRHGVHVPNAFVDINEGNQSDAKMFSQIMYWHELDDSGRMRLSRFRAGHYWLTKNHDEWFGETRIKYATARKSLERLKDRKLIYYELHGERGNPSPWIRINWHEFERRMRIWNRFNEEHETINEAIYKELITAVHRPKWMDHIWDFEASQATHTPVKKEQHAVKKSQGSVKKEQHAVKKSQGGLLKKSKSNTETTIPKTTTEITTETTTTTPPATPLLLSSSDSPVDEKIAEQKETYIAERILDLFSKKRALKIIEQHGYDDVYRICCYVAQANQTTNQSKPLTHNFVFKELNGGGNVPANYQPPEDYSRDQEWEDWKNERDNSGPEPVQEPDPVPEPKAVVEAKPDPAPKQQPVVIEQSPEENNWSAVLQQVKLQQESVFDAYLQNTKLRTVQHNTYVVEVRDEVARDVLQGRFYPLIKMLMSGLTNSNVAVRFCIPGEVVTIEPQPDPEPEKPAKVEPITPAKKPMPKTFRVVEPDEQPVTPEQLMAGRMLFQQMVSKLKADPIAEPDNITDIVAPAEDTSTPENTDVPVEIDTPTG